MARRFIVDEKDFKIEEDLIEIVGQEVKHINVLRHNIGDEIKINEYVCKIKHIDKKSITCKILKKAEKQGVPVNKITLFQALLKSDKMEWVIQKSAEIGVSKVCPIETKNIVVKLDSKDKIKKVERYNKISREASKQCGRTDVVPVVEVGTFDNIIKEKLQDFDAVFFAYEAEENSLRNAIENIKRTKSIKNIALIIGPEGGFDKEEVEKITKLDNVYSVSLGTRILRAETASLNLLSILVYELEL